jgi:hypothetical protein
MNDAEQKLRDLAPLMRYTIMVWEESINATTREETEEPYIKAAHLRKQVVGALKNIPGGGGAVEESGMTPLSAAAGVFDDDLDDVPLGQACGIDNPECDSCQ